MLQLLETLKRRLGMSYLLSVTTSMLSARSATACWSLDRRGIARLRLSEPRSPINPDPTPAGAIAQQ